jgi:hypothetical protein
MAKSSVLYNVVEVEGELVNCIYFNTGECWAQPFATQMPGVPTAEHYKPTDDEKNRYCMNEKEFRACPRFKAYQADLKASGLTR